MVSKVIWSTIIYRMDNILHGIAFITVPRSVFPADNTGRGRSQMCSTPTARTPIIHIISFVTYCIKATYYGYLPN
jgi:hypothetical protein